MPPHDIADSWINRVTMGGERINSQIFSGLLEHRCPGGVGLKHLTTVPIAALPELQTTCFIWKKQSLQPVVRLSFAWHSSSCLSHQTSTLITRAVLWNKGEDRGGKDGL